MIPFKWKFLKYPVVVALTILVIPASSTAQGILSGYCTFRCLDSNSYEIGTTLFSEGMSSAFQIIVSSESGTDTLNVPASQSSEGLRSAYTTSSFAISDTMKLLYTGPARSSEIVNIESVSPTMFTVRTELYTNNDSAQQIDLPVYQNFPLIQGEVNLPLSFNPGFVDPDGDSLSFSLVEPLDSDGEPVSDYTFPDEMQPASSNLNIDPVNGTIVWDQPQVAGKYLLTVSTQMWRGTELVASFTSDLLIDITAPTGVDNQKLDDPELTFYPNPVADRLSITATQEIQHIELYNASGLKLKNITVTSDNKVDTDLSDLPDGLYILRLNTGNKFATKKIVKSSE